MKKDNPASLFLRIGSGIGFALSSVF